MVETFGGRAKKKFGKKRSLEVYSLGLCLVSSLFLMHRLCLLAYMRWAAFLCHALPPWCFTLPSTWKQWSQSSWTEISETVSQNKSFLLLSCLGQAFCHINKKLTRMSSQNQIWKVETMKKKNIYTKRKTDFPPINIYSKRTLRITKRHFQTSRGTVP
jgi:hypothetical protein